MIDDHAWRTFKICPDRQTLESFAISQDESIFYLAGLIFGADPSILAKLRMYKLGTFTRIDWLSDITEDLGSGLVHIPLEQCMKRQWTFHFLTSNLCQERISRELRSWNIFRQRQKRIQGGMEGNQEELPALQSAFGQEAHLLVLHEPDVQDDGQEHEKIQWLLR